MSGRIATVLRLRSLQERQALGELGRGRQALAVREGHLADRWRAYAERPTGAGAGRMDAAGLQALRVAGGGALEAVQGAEATRADAAGETVRALGAWHAASVAFKSTERLADRQEEERVQVARAASERALDEIVLLTRGRQR